MPLPSPDGLFPQQFRNEFFSESLTSCPGLSYLGRPGLEQIRIRSQP